ncbi:NUDIX hydrolase [Helicobacter equorum]|uniref:NUDIX domain-containing protein n=1 Tax=Helicobacter equorum TaxID=361872 RepID=A0A3D8IT15_9HELI|nr:NUDIX hydrolase [Helicobacter equorum]RDU68428.1 NUDIX domain-containing protein [Helicobacter equorum]
MKTDIRDIQITQCVDSPYIKPQRMLYTENGYKKAWDFVQSLDSVAIILHRIDEDALVVVRQFRPPVFLKNNDGYTYELCAGLLDKEGKSIRQIAAEEVLEECGYALDSQDLQEVAVFHTSVGTSGAKQYLFYAQVTQKHKCTEGGGIDGEVIESMLLPRAELETFLYDDSIVKTPGLGFGILWFLRHTKGICA